MSAYPISVSIYGYCFYMSRLCELRHGDEGVCGWLSRVCVQMKTRHFLIYRRLMNTSTTLLSHSRWFTVPSNILTSVQHRMAVGTSAEGRFNGTQCWSDIFSIFVATNHFADRDTTLDRFLIDLRYQSQIHRLGHDV